MNVKRSWRLPVLLGGTFVSVLMSSCASTTPVTPVTPTPATEFKLVWSPQSDDAKVLFAEAAGGHVQKESLTIRNDGVAWIAFPSFSGDYSKLIDEIHSKIDQVRSSKAIVLDLRGNGGGSSDWGNQVA
jgi:Peptidase family S41